MKRSLLYLTLSTLCSSEVVVVAAEVAAKIVVDAVEAIVAAATEVVKISLLRLNGRPLVMLIFQPQSRSSASIIIPTAEELFIVLIPSAVNGHLFHQHPDQNQ